MKRVIKKCTTASLLCALLVSNLQLTVNAAAPSVQVDESMYITTDFYGNFDDVSVVKAFQLNGVKEFTDYGNYSEITNMTNRIEPTIDGEKVTWDVSQMEDQRLYVEVKGDELGDKVPWTIDVSYEINGVPAKGEELAGASGTVSTIVKATPKKDVDEYYRNNMILIYGTMIDLNKSLSLDAQGAQIQTVGTRKLAMFMALPGEESEFRVNVGTSEYESLGNFFMIVPATLESLEMVNDVREVKDKVKDSVDAMNDALDVILDNVVDMRDDLENVKSGIEGTEKAHQIYDSNREQMEANIDAANTSINNVITYLEVLNTQTEADQQNLDITIDKLTNLMGEVRGIGSFSKDMGETMNSLSSNLDTLSEIEANVINEENVQSLQSLVGTGSQGGNVSVQGIAMQATADASDKIPSALVVKDSIQGIIGYTGMMNAATGASSTPNDYVQQLTAMTPEEVAANPSIASAYQAALVVQGYERAVNALGYKMDGTTLAPVGNTAISDPSAADIGLKSLLNTYVNTVEKLDTQTGTTLYNTIGDTSELLTKATGIQSKVDALEKKTLSAEQWTDEVVREDVQEIIDQTQDLVYMTEMFLKQTQTAISSVRNTMELTEDTLSSSITLTLDGLAGTLDAGIGIANGAETLRNAKNTMKNAIDDEIDEIEEESNFLNMDVTQDKVSFTSAQNIHPESLQIIIRTAEIQMDDNTDHVTDIETDPEDIGVWGRFCKIFTDLWDSIMSIFE